MIRTFLIVVVWAIYLIAKETIFPLWNNSVALNQMNDTANSFTSLAIYQNVVAYSWIVPLIVSILIFLINKKTVEKMKESK